MTDVNEVFYWDTSAILSVLFKDSHSNKALAWAKKDRIHLISTLAYVETCAVIVRLKREGALAEVLAQTAHETLRIGPWRRTTIQPEWEIVQPLSERWSLRGADLWHLTAAKTLLKQLPKLALLTFDIKLKEAAIGEGLPQR